MTEPLIVVVAQVRGRETLEHDILSARSEKGSSGGQQHGILVEVISD